MTTFNSVSELKNHLTESIVSSNIDEIVRRVMRDYIDRNVYSAYMPEDYNRTFELIDAVDILGKSVGTKTYTFTVAINTALMSYGTSGDGWNQHASMTGQDEREYIPQWIEKGTKGGLWKREGAYFNRDAFEDLNTGQLTNALAKALRSAGYSVVFS